MWRNFAILATSSSLANFCLFTAAQYFGLLLGPFLFCWPNSYLVIWQNAENTLAKLGPNHLVTLFLGQRTAVWGGGVHSTEAAIAFHTQRPRFDSWHKQKLLMSSQDLLTANCLYSGQCSAKSLIVD